MITTTDGGTFTTTENYDLARLIFKRFGRDPEAAAAAWRRMFQNDCDAENFMTLVTAPTHTEHCDGWCTYEPRD